MRLQACYKYKGVVGRLSINHKQLGHNLQFTQRRKGAKTAKIKEFLWELFNNYFFKVLECCLQLGRCRICFIKRSCIRLTQPFQYSGIRLT